MPTSLSSKLIGKMFTTGMISRIEQFAARKTAKIAYQPGPLLRSGLLFLFCILSLNAFAAETIEVSPFSFSQSVFPLDQHIDIMSDYDGQITPQNILQPANNNQFSPIDLRNQRAVAQFGDGVWLRFSALNKTASSKELWLLASELAFESLTTYQLDSAKRQLIPITQANSLADSLYSMSTPLTLERGQYQTYYLHAKVYPSQFLSLELATPELAIEKQMYRTGFTMTVIGMLMLIVMTCLFYAIQCKSMIFLYQASYVLALGLGAFIASGIPHHWFGDFSSWQYAAILTCAYAGNANLLQVTKHHINKLGLQDRVQKIFNLAFNFNFITLFILLVVADSFSPLFALPSSVVVPVILSATFYGYSKKQDKLSLMLTFSRGAMVVAITYHLFFSNQHFDVSLISSPFLIICMILETGFVTYLFIVDELKRIRSVSLRTSLKSINEAKQTARNELLTEISHDIRTPVSGILGMTELLGETSLTLAQKENIDGINSSCQHLMHKLSEIQFRTLLHDNADVNRKAPFELTILIEACAQAFQLEAEDKHTELIINIQPDIPAIVIGDDAKLRQVLIQILDNAVKHTEQGEVIIKISRTASQPNHIEFNIVDTGIGMDKKLIEDILSDHFEIDGPNYGMVLAKQLLNQMNAKLDIRSKAGEGSTLSFTLNLPAGSNEASHENNGRDRILQGRRLLLIDDNHKSCQVLKQQAQSWGMQVTEVYDGNEAIAMFRAKRNIDEPFDAVIVDYDMPHISGIDVSRKITQETNPAPAVILLSNINDTPPESIYKKAGVSTVLNKPASQKLIKITLGGLISAMDKRDPNKRQDYQKSFRVLIAEDNDVSRRVISKMMETLGVSYKLVPDGQLAFDAIQREPFDLILMDCEMPFINGFEAAVRIHDFQKSRNRPLTPIVALTAHTAVENLQKSRDAGMSAYLTKPVSRTELESVLSQYRDL